MVKKISVPAHSYFRSKVGDLILRESSSTRLVFRAEIVDNPAHPNASVHGQLIHQRKHPGSQDWQDDNSFQLRGLRGGESVNLRLDAEATRSLFLELQQIYSLPI